MSVTAGQPQAGVVRRLDRWLHRVHQFVHAVVTRQDERVDARLRDLLGDERQWALLARLAPYDRVHHLRVYELLRAQGVSDPDLLRAALLHDVGKADGRGRVRLGHRVAVVILRAVAPRVLWMLDHADLPGPLHGFYLGEQHARLGAELAARAGASPRACAFIASHEARDAVHDPDLKLLIDADDRALT